LSVNDDIRPRNLDISLLQKTLIEQGAELRK